MNITEVDLMLVDESKDRPKERLLASCSVVFDGCFAVRDIKVVDGVNGPFICMPAKRIEQKCHSCFRKNVARAAWCNWCGIKLNPPWVENRDYYRDQAHPINNTFRVVVESAVLAEYWRQARAETDNNPVADIRDDLEFVEDESC